MQMLLTWDCNPPLHLLLPSPGDIWPLLILLHLRLLLLLLLLLHLLLLLLLLLVSI